MLLIQARSLRIKSNAYSCTHQEVCIAVHMSPGQALRISFLTFTVCACACLCVRVHACACVLSHTHLYAHVHLNIQRSKDNLQSQFFNCVGPWVQLQVVWLDARHLYPLTLSVAFSCLTFCTAAFHSLIVGVFSDDRCACRLQKAAAWYICSRNNSAGDSTRISSQ